MSTRSSKPAIPGGAAAPVRRKASISPTARSIKMLRDAGMRVEKVEQRLPIPGKFVTRDLFNMFDLLCLDGEQKGILGVQVTTMSNRGARLTKIETNPDLELWRRCGGRTILHAWRQLGKEKHWECEVTEL